MKLTINQFVKKEVIHKVTQMIDALRYSNIEFDTDNIEYKIDYEESFQIWFDSLEEDKIAELVEEYDFDIGEDYEYALRKEYSEDKDHFIRYHKIPEEEIEVQNYYAVSHFLGNKLEEKGEKILWNVVDFDAVWCRTTTGQKLEDDEVIQDIYNDFVR